MDLDEQIAQTRKKAALLNEQRELPLPPGVTVVKLKKRVSGLRVGADGVATLSTPDGEWQPARPSRRSPQSSAQT